MREKVSSLLRELLRHNSVWVGQFRLMRAQCDSFAE